MAEGLTVPVMGLSEERAQAGVTLRTGWAVESGDKSWGRLEREEAGGSGLHVVGHIVEGQTSRPHTCIARGGVGHTESWVSGLFPSVS